MGVLPDVGTIPVVARLGTGKTNMDRYYWMYAWWVFYLVLLKVSMALDVWFLQY